MHNKQNKTTKRNTIINIILSLILVSLLTLGLGLTFHRPIEDAFLNHENILLNARKHAQKKPNVTLNASTIATNNEKSKNRISRGIGADYRHQKSDSTPQIRNSDFKNRTSNAKTGSKNNNSIEDQAKETMDSWNKEQEDVHSLTALEYSKERANLDQRIKKDPKIITRYILGSIYVPNGNISLPILEGATKDHMLIGAGTVKPNEIMGDGNYALAAHNLEVSGMFFSDLKIVNKGSLAYITNLKHIFIYRIDSNKAGYSSNAINMVDDKPNKRMLTLITCSAHGKTRRIAQGTLINIMDYNNSPSWVKKGFSLDSNYKAYF